MIRSGDKDFRAILGTLPKDIDLIYASLWAPDAALLVKQLPDVGLDVRMIGPDGQYEPVDYIEASAGAAEGNYVTFLVPDLKQGALGDRLLRGVRGGVRAGQLVRPARLRGDQHHPQLDREGRQAGSGRDP